MTAARILAIGCWLLLGCMLGGHGAAAEAKLELPDPLIPGAVLQGSVVVSDADARVRAVHLPEVPGLEWKVQSGGLFQTTIINGKSSSSETVRVAMRVKNAGTLDIPAIAIEMHDGSTLHTAAVLAAAQAADANLTGEAYAEATFEPSTIVPGEPTTLIYRIYLKQDRDRAIKDPELGPPAGTISLGERSDSRGSTSDAEGVRWNVFTFRWQMTCSQTGPLEVGGQQQFYRCRRDFFDRLVPESSGQVAIKPAALTVLALPSEGRPADFTGLFGPLTVAATLERARISSGEGTMLELTVKGRQVELLKRPTLALPAGLQAYAKDDAPAQASDKGDRVFRWDLVPSTAGDYTVPAFSFSYFDPATRAYRRAESAPLPLAVLPGRSRDLAVTGAPQRPSGEAPAPSPSAPRRELPLPLRGEAATQPPPGLAWQAAAAALLAGLAIGLTQRWRAQAPRGPHRGRALGRALADRDPTAIAHAAQELLPDLREPAQRDAVERILQAAELARFGNQPLADGLADLARTVEDVA